MSPDECAKTAERASKAMHYLTKGYNETVEGVVGSGVFFEDVNEMVVVQDIDMCSLCEHHLLPFYGTVSVGYLPSGKILGLSKVAR